MQPNGWKLIVKRKAMSYLKRLPKDEQHRIAHAINNLLALLSGKLVIPPDIRPLKGEYEGFFRIRVGKYRIIYTIQENEKKLVIRAVESRGDVYK